MDVLVNKMNEEKWRKETVRLWRDLGLDNRFDAEEDLSIIEEAFDSIVKKISLESSNAHLLLYEKCRICGKKALGAAPLDTDLKNLECSQCHNMTSEAITRDEFEGS